MQVLPPPGEEWGAEDGEGFGEFEQVIEVLEGLGYAWATSVTEGRGERKALEQVSSDRPQGLGWEADAGAGTSSPGGTRIPPARWHLCGESWRGYDPFSERGSNRGAKRRRIESKGVRDKGRQGH